ncbi:MAG: DMT family transporter [Cyanobacteria bacterium P01_H01_bin.121]
MQTKQLNFAKSPLFLVAPFFFLGTAMVVMKFIIPNTTPLFLAAFRLLPAGLLVLGLTTFLKLPQPKTLTAWLWILLFSIVDGAMFQGFLTEGLVHTGAGIGAVLIDAQPLVVAILSRLFFGDLIGPWGWLGLGVGITGISLCGLPEAWIYNTLDSGISFGNLSQAVGNTLEGQVSLASLSSSGEVLMLLAALSMSLGTIIIRYLKQHADPVVATGWHMILGGLPLMVLSLVWETGQISSLQTGDWLGLGYATVFGTAVTYGMFFYLAATGNLTSVSALIFLTPVFALLFSSLFLGEELSQLKWIGVAFTLVSVYLVNQRQEIAEKVNALPNRAGTETSDAMASNRGLQTASESLEIDNTTSTPNSDPESA